MVEVLLSREHIPFSHAIGEVVGGGLHSQVRELGPDWVVKAIYPVWQLSSEWEKDMKEEDALLKEFLSSYIPPTGLVKGGDYHGRENLLVVQKRIEGRHLRDMPLAQLQQMPDTIDQLIDFANRSMVMYRATGRVPDLHGGPELYKQYRIKDTDNVLIDGKGKVNFTDTNMIGPLWKPSWIGGRIHVKLMYEALERFTRQLKGKI